MIMPDVVFVIKEINVAKVANLDHLYDKFKGTIVA